MRIEANGDGRFVVKDENDTVWFGPATYEECEEYLTNNPTPPATGPTM